MSHFWITLHEAWWTLRQVIAVPGTTQPNGSRCNNTWPRRLVCDFHFPGFLVCIISFSRQYVYLNDFECIYIICIIYMLFNPNILLWWFFYIYLYILIYYIPNIIVYLFIMYYLMLYRFFYPTGCTKAIVAARGFLSKNPPPWDDPWVNMGGHPPYLKKKNTLLDFLFGLRK